jgi:protein-glucosylgalactosylhydroxylysine glucosidase
MHAKTFIQCFISSSLMCVCICINELEAQNKIDRKALVQRHTVINTKADSLSSLSVGNGGFAFTADITGLQSFPDYYRNGVPLGTESEWGWHSFPNDSGYRFEESIKQYQVNGRVVPYSVQWSEPARNKNAANYFRQNVHRLQLGNIGFELVKKDGSIAGINDIANIHQELNMWTGEIRSHFTIENIPVDVITCGHQQQDVIAIQVKSILIKEGRLHIRLRFPYPTGEWADAGNNWLNEDKHQSSIVRQTNWYALIKHVLDTTVYYAAINWQGNASLKEKSKHYFLCTPAATTGSFAFTCRFGKKINANPVPSFIVVKENNEWQWPLFWKRGGAIDFTGSTDKRAFELERRIILSQYLTKIQCAGNYPPQETGLTCNSWYGKPHLEMHWWHAVHFALWGRIDLLEKSLGWYAKVQGQARKLAKRQGYDGIRWQKMTDPEGRESPSSVGAFLIWQQPHFIYFAELCYREHKDNQTLQRYKNLVFATADFMASYAHYDSVKATYILGKGVIPAQERFKPEETFNPTYELAYWYWALSAAQCWRRRLHLPENKKWRDVLQKISPLPVKDSVYLATESATDSYTNPAFKTDHPSVLGTYGMLPLTPLLDTLIMQHTFKLVLNIWNWNNTWGWDFPMTAMTATRLGLPDEAMDALLMPVKTNTWLPNGHNYQDDRLRLYLPGNGGLLTAIAVMCAGYDGCNRLQPGIPKNPAWKLKWEGLRKIL